MWKDFWIAIRAFAGLTILTGVVYPLIVTGLGKTFFPEQASGSILKRDGVAIGSKLIAQKFTSPKYFWGRPSAIDWNPLPSGGSNLSGTSAALMDSIEARKKEGRSGDLLFASASGLDPEISPESARAQIDRVASARKLGGSQQEALRKLVERSIQRRTFGVLGEERVNVLGLNLAVDEVFGK